MEKSQVPPTGEVWIDYMNHRGYRSGRLITPLRFYFGRNEWHPEPQWLCDAWDQEKQAKRTFALKSIHRWENIVDSSTIPYSTVNASTINQSTD